MAKGYDIVFFDSVGIPFDGDSPMRQGMGASEHQVIMLAEALAERGRRVLVINNNHNPGSVIIRGVEYRRRHILGEVDCTTLIICRYSSLGDRTDPIHRKQTIIWATDIPDDKYARNIDRAIAAQAQLVVLSDWHASLFPNAKPKVIPLAVPDDLYPSRVPVGCERTFVYASAALKGLAETLAMWKLLRPEDGGELHVCLPGYESHGRMNAEHDEAMKVPGVRWFGSLTPAAVIEKLRNSAGLFYVNAFPETFCVTAALAEALGRRVHILCTSDAGLAGLPAAVSSPLVTTHRRQFVEDFKGLIDWRPSPPRPVRMATVVKQWQAIIRACPEHWVDARTLPTFPEATLRILPPEMKPKKNRLALCMIVKDEAEVIARAIASTEGIIDSAVIVDTGSTDDTKAKAARALLDLGIPGDRVRIVDRKWVDFAHNRNETLELAGEVAEYALVLDADDVIELDPEGNVTLDQFLDSDAIELEIFDDQPSEISFKERTLRVAGTTYWRTHIVRVSPDKGFRYKWPRHESLVKEGPFTTRRATNLRYLRGPGGARSRDSKTYVRDAQAIDEWLGQNPGDTRMAYYLGQSWLDAARRATTEKKHDFARRYRESALAAFLRRGVMEGGFFGETYVALWHAGNLAEQLGRSPGQVVELWLRAVEVDARRAETLFELARFYGQRKNFNLCLLFAGEGLMKEPPSDGLFVELGRYGWQMREWYAVAQLHLGKKDLARGIFEKLLAEVTDPAQKERLAANLAFASEVTG